MKNIVRIFENCVQRSRQSEEKTSNAHLPRESAMILIGITDVILILNRMTRRMKMTKE